MGCHVAERRPRGLSLAAVPAQQTGHKTVWNLDDRCRQAKQIGDDDDNKVDVENGTKQKIMKKVQVLLTIRSHQTHKSADSGLCPHPHRPRHAQSAYRRSPKFRDWIANVQRHLNHHGIALLILDPAFFEVA